MGCDCDIARYTCGAQYAWATHDCGAPFRCTLMLGHTGEHQDHSHRTMTGGICCWLDLPEVP